MKLADGFDLVWCSGWEEKADEHLPHALALPGGRPFLSSPLNPVRANSHPKLAAIDEHAVPRRPLAWVGDAHGEACRAWAEARAAPTLLVATTPAVGLTAAHADELTAWAAATAGAR